MRKIFFLSLFFIILANSNSSANSLGVATVDTRILLMLHPLMADFDYAMGRFYKDSSENKKIKDVYSELIKAQTETEPKRKELQKEYEDLKNQKFSLEVLIEKNKNPISPNDIEQLKINKAYLQKALDSINQNDAKNKEEKRVKLEKAKDLEERIKELDKAINYKFDKTKAQNKVKELQKQLKDINDLISKNSDERLILEDKAISAVYYSSKETNERVEKVKEEIRKLIEKAAKESKYSIVIDTSFAMRSVTKKRRRAAISLTEDSPDIVSTNLFHSFINLEITDELLKSTNLPGEYAQKHIVAGHTIGMQSNLKQYLEFRNYMPNKLSSLSNGKMFLIGGNDITPYIARQLFDKYTIPDVTKNMLLKTLKEYVSFESDPVIREVDY